jgi:hypothetical protein
MIVAFTLIGGATNSHAQPASDPDATASAERIFVENANHRFVSKPRKFKLPIWAGSYDETYLIKASGLRWRNWGGHRTWSKARFKTCAHEYGCSYKRGVIFAWARGWTKCKPGPGSIYHYNWVGFRMRGSATVKLWLPRCPYI